jgi:hypothetical protein
MNPRPTNKIHVRDGIKHQTNSSGIHRTILPQNHKINPKMRKTQGRGIASPGRLHLTSVWQEQKKRKEKWGSQQGVEAWFQKI